MPRSCAARGSELLVVVTNDGWFGTSAAPATHAVFSAFRAAENGRYLLRAAATGVSLVCDPQGRILSSIPLNRRELLSAEVRPRKTLTIYTRFGNWLCWIGLLMLCLDFFPSFRNGYPSQAVI